jgi:lysylphosphatidylglycerol synthetase-like protein (DUF2156 family)
MNQLLETISTWLADYYLLSSVLLAITLVVLASTRQPARRRAVAQSALAGLFLMAALCAAPGWSTISLLTWRQPDVTHQARHELNERLIVNQGADKDWGFSTSNNEGPRMPRAAATESVVITSIAPVTATGFSSSALVALAWIGGVLGVISWLVLGSFAAHRMRRRAQNAPRELIENRIDESDRTERRFFPKPCRVAGLKPC